MEPCRRLENETPKEMQREVLVAGLVEMNPIGADFVSTNQRCGVEKDNSGSGGCLHSGDRERTRTLGYRL